MKKKRRKFLSGKISFRLQHMVSWRKSMYIEEILKIIFCWKGFSLCKQWTFCFLYLLMGKRYMMWNKSMSYIQKYDESIKLKVNQKKNNFNFLYVVLFIVFLKTCTLTCFFIEGLITSLDYLSFFWART